MQKSTLTVSRASFFKFVSFCGVRGGMENHQSLLISYRYYLTSHTKKMAAMMMSNNNGIPSMQQQEQAVVYCSNEQEYYQAIESAGPHRLVVVDCYAEWCPPCKQIAPVFDALARENSQTTNDIVFVKVDVDKVPTIKSILGVWAMPSFFFLKDGNKVGSFMGANENLLRKGIANDGYVGSICSSCIIQ